MNEVLRVVRDRRSVRKFEPGPLEREVLEEIIEAGRWAPTGGDCQTVRFMAISSPDVLAELRRRVNEAFLNMEPQPGDYISITNSIKMARAGGYVYDYGAPHLVVVSNGAGYPNAMADCSCALQNMMLAATSLGVGSCWINQLHWLEEHLLVRPYLEELGLPADQTVCGAVALGRAAVQLPRRPRHHMPVQHI